MIVRVTMKRKKRYKSRKICRLNLAAVKYADHTAWGITLFRKTQIIDAIVY